MEDNTKSKLKKNIIMVLMLVIFIAIITFAVYQILKNKQEELPILESLSVEELENMENVDFYFGKENSTNILIAGNFADAKITNEAEALNLLNTVKDILKIENIEDEFKVSSNNKFMNDNNFRIQQYYDGIVVDGMQLIVTSDAEGNIKSLSGDYLKIEDLDTEAKITKSEVSNILEKNYGTEIEIGEVELKITKIDDKPVLIWEAIASGTFTNLGDYSYIFYIDANSGEILDKKSVIMEVDKANCSATVDEETINFEATRNDDGTFNLTDLDRHILVGKYISATSASPIESTNANEWTDEIAIKAYTGVQKVYDYYKIKFNYNLTVEKPISVAIHYKGAKRNDANNAMYVHDTSLENTLIVIGEGDGENFNNFAEGLDVIAHEITHAYVAQTLGNGFKMGEINEGYADVMGVIIENYFEEKETVKPYSENENLTFTNDWLWLIGEDIIKSHSSVEGTNAIRGLRRPELLGQPSTIYDEDYKSGSDVEEHENCTVMGNTAFKMWNRGLTTDEITYIYTNSCQRLSPWASYSDVGNMFLTICKEIAPGKIETLRAILKEQGILEGWEAEKVVSQPISKVDYFCEYNGEIYYWKLSDTSREKTGLSNNIYNLGVENQLVKIDKDGKETVIYTGTGSKEICIVNDRIFLSCKASDSEYVRKICSINLDGTDKQEHAEGEMKYIVSDYIICQDSTSIYALNTENFGTTKIVEQGTSEIIEIITAIKDNIYYSIYNYEDHTIGISTITGVTSDKTTKITISNEFGEGFEEAGLLEVAYMWKDVDTINMYIDFREGTAHLINGIVKVTMDENLNNAQVLEADRNDLTTVMDTATNGVFVGITEENGNYERYVMKVDDRTGEIENIFSTDEIYEKYSLTDDTEHTLSIHNITEIENEIYMIWDYRTHSPENDIGWRYAYTRERTIYLKYNTETKEITTIYEF